MSNKPEAPANADRPTLCSLLIGPQTCPRIPAFEWNKVCSKSAMSDLRPTLRILGFALHVVAAGVLVLLFLKTGGMTVFCVVAGALIGCASVPARPGRPITVYAAFGLLMGYAFWMGASAISQGNFLLLLFLLVLAGGAVWLLEQPRWPAALFTAIMVLFLLGLAAVQYRHADLSDYDPTLVRHTALTTLMVLGLALAYIGLGCAESSFLEPANSKRPARRKRLRSSSRRGDD